VVVSENVVVVVVVLVVIVAVFQARVVLIGLK